MALERDASKDVSHESVESEDIFQPENFTSFHIAQLMNLAATQGNEAAYGKFANCGYVAVTFDRTPTVIDGDDSFADFQARLKLRGPDSHYKYVTLAPVKKPKDYSAAGSSVAGGSVGS